MERVITTTIMKSLQNMLNRSISAESLLNFRGFADQFQRRTQ